MDKTLPNVLFLRPGPVPPPRDPEQDSLYHLSAICRGDVLQTSWDATIGPNPKTHKTGLFTYHFSYRINSLPPGFKFMWELGFLVVKGILLHIRKENYDAIVSYGTTKTGLAAVLLKIFTGAKLIIEVPGNPSTAFRADSPTASIMANIKHAIADILLWFSTARADHLRLLYPEQVAHYKHLNRTPRSVFHEFTSISGLEPSKSDDHYIFFLGGPWYLKGVDILIKAFSSLKQEFPNYRLVIVGWDFGNEALFDGLAAADPRVELRRPGLPKKEAMELMSRCTFFVLPSRTEGMGRVLLEAMAQKKAVVASRTDGIPHYITHNETGLLFEKENIQELASCLRTLLRDEDLRKRLEENGCTYVRSILSEARYVEEYSKMLTQVLVETA